MRWGYAAIAAGLIFSGAAGSASADRREASLHAQMVGGVATTTDAQTSGDASAPLGGLSFRASYATRNSLQYDVSLSLLATGGAAFPSSDFMPVGHPPVSGPYTIQSQVTRLDGGATLRLGVAWIPTVRLAAGVQGRRRGAPVVTSGGIESSGEDETGRGGDLGLDLVGVATVGLDHRLSRRIIVGAAVGASVAVPLGGETFRTLEVTAHAAYYWYPRL